MFNQFHTGMESKMRTQINLTGVFLVLSFNPEVDSFEMFSDLGRKRERIVTFVTFDFCFWVCVPRMIVHVILFGSFVVTFFTFYCIPILDD